MTDAAVRLAAAAQIIRAVVNTLPPQSLASVHLLQVAADELARDHERAVAADDHVTDFWETI